jgi:hypothetical protein
MHIVFEMKHNVHMLICINKHDFGSNKFTYDKMFVKGTIQQKQQQYLSIGHLQQSTHVIDFK